MWLDKTIGKIFYETYIEFKDDLKSEDQPKEIFVSYFKYIKEVISSGHFPTIKIPKFGTLTPSVSNMEKISGFYEKKNGEFYEDASKKMKDSINRLKKEKIKRKRNGSRESTNE